MQPREIENPGALAGAAGVGIRKQEQPKNSPQKSVTQAQQSEHRETIAWVDFCRCLEIYQMHPIAENRHALDAAYEALQIALYGRADFRMRYSEDRHA